MSYLLWQSGGDTRIASTRLVLRAAEVPLLQEALSFTARLSQLHRDEARRVAEAEHESQQRGHAQGREEGRREAREQVAASLVALAQASAQQRERLQGQVAELALQVARKLLGRFADDELLLALADTAARETLPVQVLSLTVHPDHCEAVRARLEADAPAWRCEVRGDPACPPGTCRLETELGSVDASLDAQLSRLADAWGVR
ncbi:type III secretion system stator protein SctL [Piscinibacter sp. XHJ-5]|uniref:type III secretion system stator protein SctL n=1 Tax=Piscinibacter sp. XHJ-5 TaxID=3037797 RepID=UPI0024531C85|nr:type III secretion system stator protein SctL [Piscinibacter sp. XHJ-5]